MPNYTIESVDLETNVEGLPNPTPTLTLIVRSITFLWKFGFRCFHVVVLIVFGLGLTFIYSMERSIRKEDNHK